MSRKLCLLLLATLCIAVTVVKSESYIEVDENGDEYEIKRFNIQGRQLNGGRSQCVVTRRKRSSVIYSQNDESNENDQQSYQQSYAQGSPSYQQQSYSQGNAMLYFSPATVADANDERSDADDEDDENTQNNDDAHHHHQHHQTAYGVVDVGGGEEDAEEEEDEENETINVIQVPNKLPMIGHLHGKGHSVGVGSSSNKKTKYITAASPASSSSSSALSGNGIMVFHSVEPPKVNPQTHAVFELRPVVNQEQQNIQPSYVDNNNAQVIHIGSPGFVVPGGLDDNDDFKFDEEINPVTTTAIWSTGEDDSDDYLPPAKTEKPPKHQNVNHNKKDDKDNNKMKRKQPFNNSAIKKNKPSRKTSYSSNNKSPNKKNNVRPSTNRRPSNSRRPNSRRRPVNRRRPSSSYNRRGGYRRQNGSGVRNSTRRRRPNSANRFPSDRIVTTSALDDDEDLDIDNFFYRARTSDKKKSKSTSNNASDDKKEVTKKRRNRGKVNATVQTETASNGRVNTHTGVAGPEGENVNCILINKDSPSAASVPSASTTTRRPFWNVMGRSASNNGPRALGHYGTRKRINLRLLV